MVGWIRVCDNVIESLRLILGFQKVAKVYKWVLVVGDGMGWCLG